MSFLRFRLEREAALRPKGRFSTTAVPHVHQLTDGKGVRCEVPYPVRTGDTKQSAALDLLARPWRGLDGVGPDSRADRPAGAQTAERLIGLRIVFGVGVLRLGIRYR